MQHVVVGDRGQVVSLRLGTEMTGSPVEERSHVKLGATTIGVRVCILNIVEGEQLGIPVGCPVEELVLHASGVQILVRGNLGSHGGYLSLGRINHNVVLALREIKSSGRCLSDVLCTCINRHHQHASQCQTK